MQLGDEQAQSSLRFSFGRFNSAAEVEEALRNIPAVMRKLRELSSVSLSAAS
jgi:cysteine sulfinate desulfinase/cysteine desulfurase-like protein